MSKVIEINGKQFLQRTEEDEERNFTYLSLIESTDGVPDDYEKLPNFQENIIYLESHDRKFRNGFIMKYTIDLMLKYAKYSFDKVFIYDGESLRFLSSSFEERNAGIDALAHHLRSQDIFETLRGWRNEKYVLYDLDKKPYALVERALTNIFGIITYGIHVNGAVIDANNNINFWIPRRSAQKATWPLKYDNIIAGGLGYPYGIHETLIKECLEEGNLEEDVVLKYTKPVGCLSYLYYAGDFVTDKFDKESSSITGEIEFIYDMFLPQNIKPIPNDGEVDSFKLYTLQETIDLMKTNDFKPNCALVMVDFLVRHGYITPENEPNYSTIVQKMHRSLPFPSI